MDLSLKGQGHRISSPMISKLLLTWGFCKSPCVVPMSVCSAFCKGRWDAVFKDNSNPAISMKAWNLLIQKCFSVCLNPSRGLNILGFILHAGNQTGVIYKQGIQKHFWVFAQSCWYFLTSELALSHGPYLELCIENFPCVRCVGISVLLQELAASCTLVSDVGVLHPDL